MHTLILQYLKTNGEGLDLEIAKALHLPVTQVKTQISQLSSAGEVICCKVTRYVDGKKIEGISCRLSGNVPTPARGPKPGAKREASAEKKVA